MFCTSGYSRGETHVLEQLDGGGGGGGADMGNEKVSVWPDIFIMQPSEKNEHGPAGLTS